MDRCPGVQLVSVAIMWLVPSTRPLLMMIWKAQLSLATGDSALASRLDLAVLRNLGSCGVEFVGAGFGSFFSATLSPRRDVALADSRDSAGLLGAAASGSTGPEVAPESSRVGLGHLEPHLIDDVGKSGSGREQKHPEEGEPGRRKGRFVVRVGVPVRCIDNTPTHLFLKLVENFLLPAGHDRANLRNSSRDRP